MAEFSTSSTKQELLQKVGVLTDEEMSELKARVAASQATGGKGLLNDLSASSNLLELFQETTDHDRVHDTHDRVSS